MPIEGVISAKWRNSVIDGNGRVNRISYELCVLIRLRECIRSKEIWVAGADRYRNPDDDLPKDFAVRRSSYYSRLNLTQNAREFVASVRKGLEQELLLLNETIPRNDKVRIRWCGENRISITPFKPAPEQKGLSAIKSETGQRWSRMNNTQQTMNSQIQIRAQTLDKIPMVSAKGIRKSFGRLLPAIKPNGNNCNGH